MASISSLHSLSISSLNKPNLHKLIGSNFPAPSISLGVKGGRNKHVLCSYKKHCEEEEGEEQDPLFSLKEQWGTTGTKRREALFNTALIAFTFPIAFVASAATDVAEDFLVYTDDANKFQISIPQGWQLGTGEPSGFKSVTAFYPEEASSSVTVAITGLGPDFTRLESFGKVDAFAETLVGGLDRSWQRPPGVAAKLIDSKAANGFYYIEYTLQNPGESCRNLVSALGVASNGWINRLYTVTGQFVDEESEKFGTNIRKAVSSFRFIQ